MKTWAHIARLGLGIALLSASVASFAKNDTYDLVATGTGRDLSVSPAGVITGEVTGQATLLGNFTGILVIAFNGNDKTFGGSGYLRAPNGDRLYFEHKGKIETKRYPYELKGQVDVTGGTGAFDGASGKLKLGGLNFGAGVSEYSFEGKLSFDD